MSLVDNRFLCLSGGSSEFSVGKIVMLGASITNHSTSTSTTQMLIAYIKNKYDKDITIINEATSGWDTADLRLNIDSIIATYSAETETVFYLHIGGGDIATGTQFLDLGASAQAQKIADLEYIYDAIHAQGQIVVQSSLTFRNYSGTTIDSAPFPKVNELGGSYTYTRDWIVEVMKNKAPQFLSNDWPVVDEYNISRNIYKDWRDPLDPSDYVHPGRFGQLIYEQHAIESIIELSLGSTVSSVTPRNFGDSLLSGSAIDFTVGLGRDLDIGSTDDNINWVIRTRALTIGTEPIYLSTIKNTAGVNIPNIKLYSYVDATYRRGAGNTTDPLDNSASIVNDVLLESGLGVELGNGSLYVIIENLDVMKTYTVGFSASVDPTADFTSNYTALTDDNTPKVINAASLTPDLDIQYSLATTDYKGRIFIAISEQNINNRAIISGLQITAN